MTMRIYLAERTAGPTIVLAGFLLLIGFLILAFLDGCVKLAAVIKFYYRRMF